MHALAAEREQCDETELGDRDPGERERPPERDAEPEDRELGRHAEVREDDDGLAVVVGEPRLRACAAEPPGDEALDEPVLRRVQRDVEAAQEPVRAPGRLGHRRRVAAALGPVEPLDVEVDAQHRREREEAQGERGERPAGVPADGREQRGVDEQVELGVEVAAEGRDPSREARELAVGVVEHRLQLDEQRGDDEVASRQLDGRRDARRTRRGRDERRRHAQRQQREHDEVRERTVDAARTGAPVRPSASWTGRGG